MITSNAPSLRVVFMGTPELAAVSLRALLQCHHEVVAVVSQPDRRSGRGKRMQAPPVAALAREHDLPLLQVTTAKTVAFRRWVASHAPDIAVVAAFGHILGPKALAMPRLGCINVHTSLLPRWRGASPIQAAIAAGDERSGVTIMQMDAGMDTGPMLRQVETEITDDDTGSTLHDRLAALGARAVVETLDAIAYGTSRPTPQPSDGMTYAGLLSRSDSVIDWTKPAVDVWQRIRAYHPWPGARTTLGEDVIRFEPPVSVRALAAAPAAGATPPAPGEVVSASGQGVVVATGEGAVVFQRLQRPGKKMLDAAAFLAGYSLTPGMRFGGDTSRG